MITGDAQREYFGRVVELLGGCEAAVQFAWDRGQIVTVDPNAGTVGIMSHGQAKRFAAILRRDHPADPAVDWLRNGNGGRVFVHDGYGTLCLDFDPANGTFRTAPGTLDREWTS